MELKRTNSPIAFLCPCYQLFMPSIDIGSEVDLASNWCANTIVNLRKNQDERVFTSNKPCVVIDIEFFEKNRRFVSWTRCPWRWGNTCSHFEHRSQAHQRRLYCHKWETSTVPNYINSPPKGGFWFSHLFVRLKCLRYTTGRSWHASYQRRRVLK